MINGIINLHLHGRKQQQTSHPRDDHPEVQVSQLQIRQATQLLGTKPQQRLHPL